MTKKKLKELGNYWLLDRIQRLDRVLVIVENTRNALQCGGSILGLKIGPLLKSLSSLEARAGDEADKAEDEVYRRCNEQDFT
jgi:hypothetical protein